MPHVCEKCVPLSKRLRTEASNGTTDRTSAPVKLYRLRRENSYECSVLARLRSEYHCATKGWRWTQTTRRRAGDGETNDSSFIIIIRAAACVGHSERVNGQGGRNRYAKKTEFAFKTRYRRVIAFLGKAKVRGYLYFPSAGT